jgi:hypothetical protein
MEIGMEEMYEHKWLFSASQLWDVELDSRYSLHQSLLLLECLDLSIPSI